MKMKMHEAAMMFPPMKEYEYDQLKNDISDNGCHIPIWKYKGEIIDGRHRFKACEELNIEPKYETFEGSDEEMIAFVISQNLHRRQLSESQRAMVAANMANMSVGKPLANNKKTGGLDQATAAMKLNVSNRSVSSAAVVKNNGSKLLNDVVSKGDVSVSAAEKIAKEPHDIQDKAIKSGAKTASDLKKAITHDEKKIVTDIKYELILKRSGSEKIFFRNKYESMSELYKKVNATIDSNGWESFTVSKCE